MSVVQGGVGGGGDGADGGGGDGVDGHGMPILPPALSNLESASMKQITLVLCHIFI